MADLKNQNGKRNDTYDLLHSSFSLNAAKNSALQEEPDVKNSGEIYFSANADEYQEKLYDLSRFDGSSSVSRRPIQQRASASRSAPSQTAKKGRTGAAVSGKTPSNRTGTTAASSTGTQRTRASAPTGKPASRTQSTAAAGGTASKSAAAQKPQRQSAPSAATASAAARSRAANAAAPVQKKKSNTGGSDSKHGSGFALAALIIIFVVVVSFIIRIPLMGCINDIIAINRDKTEINVSVGANMNTNDVIDLLKEKDLIYSAKFCKLVYSVLGHDENEIYPAGTYSVSASMGLEGMLREIITAGATDATVSIPFPEGFTIDQIIERLASNGVASSSALYAVIDDPSFIAEYEFLEGVDNREQRYHYLEGYMYPDTYEFYIGENPASVISRFLKNFNEKWNSEFADRIAKTNYSIDDVLTVASILEKEAKDADQMPLIASIIYNRLDSSSFPHIQCDSTAKYIENNKNKLVQAGRYASLLKVYDSYQVTGLPVGPIGNPGANAISAALSPEATDYYYFIHDATGQIYVASNSQEHQENMERAGIS